MQTERFLSLIPEIATFDTFSELEEKTRRLAAEFPGSVKLRELGLSKQGRPILCLCMGSGPKNALCFACPHPNEPIGAMTLSVMSRIFAENPQLLEETGFTWYMIPCIDPDGLVLNESWLKGPFTLENYARGFFRPAGDQQVEWTFPIDYKGLVFDRPIPETRALMRLIDEIKPRLMFSLHNAAFGGAYWYLTDNMQALCAQLENAAHRQGIPLQLGEPETAYSTKFSPAVHSMMSMYAWCDYMETYLGGVPRQSAICGTCSADYASSVCTCTTMMAELPYFFDARIGDQGPSDVTRRQAIEEGLHVMEENYAVLRQLWGCVEPFFQRDNPFPPLVKSCIDSLEDTAAAKLRWAVGPEFEKPATVAERFDNLVGQRIFELLNLGLAVRGCDYELEKMPAGPRRTELEGYRAKLSGALSDLCAKMEERCSFEVIPIRKLVAVQTESALLAAQALREEEHAE